MHRCDRAALIKWSLREPPGLVVRFARRLAGAYALLGTVGLWLVERRGTRDNSSRPCVDVREEGRMG